MDVKLVVTEGKQAGQEVPIPVRKFFIGRAEDCHLRPHSDLISRHHCVILVEEGMIAIRDFGSKNGTFVNGEKITAEVELKAGDRLKVGNLEFEVRVVVGVAAKKLPKVRSVQEAVVRTVEKQKPRSEKPADKDEADVAGWLDEDDSRAMSETTTLEPTQTIAKSGSASGASQAPDLDPEEPMEEEEPVEQQRNSRDDAAAALKNMFRGF